MAKPNHVQPAVPGLPPPRTPTPRSRARVSVTRAPSVQSAPSQTTQSQSAPSQTTQSQSAPSQITQPSPKLPEPRYEAQRRWFDHEVRTLQRLAQTERFAGDFVAAQRLERELDSFIREAAALLEQERPR